MPVCQDTTDALLKLGDLIHATIATYVEKKRHPDAQGVLVPPKDLFDAQRTLLAAAGALTELVSDPRARLLEVGLQYFEARALHIVTDKRIADILAKNGDSGVNIKALSVATGIEAAKLSRVMRCLCSIHIFKEIGEDVFANNVISASLINNEPLRANILFPALDVYSASNALPLYLSDAAKGHSYAADVTPWQDAVGTTQSRWDWLDEKVTYDNYKTSMGSSGYPGAFGDELASFKALAEDGAPVARPEHSIFGLAMVETGEVLGRPHLYDFPWATLGKATVVDVGGGVGSFSLKLSHEFPDLQFVIQDRAAVLKQAETQVWPKNNKAALDAGRVQFMPHDFFNPNPVKNADVYWVRHVLHNWSDDYCVRVLTAIKSAMGPKSRILLCDQVMNTTRGSSNLPSAPEPLPANWGYYTRYSHQRDLAMMACLNGIERKPIEFMDIIERAGLRVVKMWDCRSQVGLIEVALK